MKIINTLPSTRSRLLRMAKLGKSFEAFRLSRNIRQEVLAEQAGIARSTLARLEKEGAATLDTTLRVLEALGLEDRLDLLLPEIKESPLDPKSSDRQRATGGEVYVGATARSWKRAQKAAKISAGMVHKIPTKFYGDVEGTYPAADKLTGASMLPAGTKKSTVSKSSVGKAATLKKRPKWGDER